MENKICSKRRFAHRLQKNGKDTATTGICYLIQYNIDSFYLHCVLDDLHILREQLQQVVCSEVRWSWNRSSLLAVFLQKSSQLGRFLQRNIRLNKSLGKVQNKLLPLTCRWGMERQEAYI